MTIRKIMYFLGHVNVTISVLIMTYLAIMQWYAPNNTIILYFNNFGEAYLEYIMGIIMIPCTLYYLFQSFKKVI